VYLDTLWFSRILEADLFNAAEWTREAQAMSKIVETRLALMRSASDFWMYGKEGARAATAYKISSLLLHIKEQYHLNAHTAGEQVVVVGTHNLDKGLWQTSPAEMIALDKGLVICHLSHREAAVYCSGFIERSRNGHRYDVRTFSNLNGEMAPGKASIKVGPGKIENKAAAARFDWKYGHDQGSSIGISADNWVLLQHWLDRWLVPGH
jgi:hypothetical protein